MKVAKFPPAKSVTTEYDRQSKVLAGVGERSSQRRSCTVRSSGATRRANVGMSSDKASENLARRKPKVS